MSQSKTGSSTPRLSEYARKFTFPAGIRKTVWPRVEAKGVELGLGFDWWQAQLGMVCLGYGDNGRYRATVGGVGLSIPRQVGKTYFVMAMLVIMCVLFPGLQVVWTSHHMRTTNKTLKSIQGLTKRKKIAPHIKTVRVANGEGQVEFGNGSMIYFGARAQGFGRGFDEIDVEVFDEAQILDTKALEDMVAATNQARHEHGALLFFMGTPPRPSDPSESFVMRRREAWSGEEEDAIWLEIGADPRSHANDESQWARMNPSYPLRTPRESLLRLRKNLKDDDSWNREGRGIWDDDAGEDSITPADWANCLDIDSKIEDRHAFALDVSPALSSAAIVVAGARADDKFHVEVTGRGEVVDHRPGTGWIVERLLELQASQINFKVWIAEGSAAKSLMPQILEAGIKAETIKAGEVTAACGLFYTEAKASGVKHTGQRELASAVAGASKVDVGDGAWKWTRRKSSTDITPLYAATVALWVANRKRRTPNVW